MIKKFISYYKPHRALFALDFVCAFLMACCDLFYPLIARDVINDYVPNKNLRMLLISGAVLLSLYLLKTAFGYIVHYYGHTLGVRMQGDMRREVFTHLQKLPFSYFDENKTGVIMSRINNDLMDISELAHHGPEDLFLSVVMLLASFVILCTINVPLTLIIFALLPAVVIFSVKLRKKMTDAFTESRVENAEINAILENSIAGIRVSRSYTSSKRELEKFDKCNYRFINAKNYAYKVMAWFTTGTTFFTDALYLVVLVAGGLFYYYEIINTGEFAAYLLYISLFLTPIRKFIALFEQYQNGITGFKRFIEIMEQPIEPEDENAIRVDKLDGVIDFEDVTFKYNSSDEDERKVINNLSLHIEKGKTVALVGPSGGGKSTVCNLIPRFYELESGRILIDNTDITLFERESLRKNIGTVAQEVFLFTGTIKENIAYGNFDATDEEIISAAKKANIHDYIMSLPDGYDTFIGERGVKLSGGQKQRVSIARVFLKNPSILILDEATSALDNTTELLIEQSLEELSKGRTSIIVAHRLSTVRRADEIIVLTDEGVIERGSHEELLELGGMYAELYKAQFRGI